MTFEEDILEEIEDEDECPYCGKIIKQKARRFKHVKQCWFALTKKEDR